MENDIQKMVLTMDSRVQRVAEFMQKEFAADELQGVAEALGKLAPALWGNFAVGSIIQPLGLNYPPIPG